MGTAGRISTKRPVAFSSQPMLQKAWHLKPPATLTPKMLARRPHNIIILRAPRCILWKPKNNEIFKNKLRLDAPSWPNKNSIAKTHTWRGSVPRKNPFKPWRAASLKSAACLPFDRSLFSASHAARIPHHNHKVTRNKPSSVDRCPQMPARECLSLEVLQRGQLRRACPVKM